MVSALYNAGSGTTGLRIQIYLGEYAAYVAQGVP